MDGTGNCLLVVRYCFETEGSIQKRFNEADGESSQFKCPLLTPLQFQPCVLI